MNRRFIAYGLLAVLMLAGTASPLLAKNGMSKQKQGDTPIVDLVTLLPPPPAPNSAENKAEIKELLDYQNSRTPEQVASAQADAEKSVFRFKDVLGDKFTAENLPLTAALFEKTLKVAKETVNPAKSFFNRTRPFLFDQRIKPCLEKEMEPSYPSGHSTAGMMMAVLLANMIPEKRAELLKRGWEYARNREIGGVHYRSDIEAGRTSGTLIAFALLRDPKFMNDFVAAKAELRNLLNY